MAKKGPVFVWNDFVTFRAEAALIRPDVFLGDLVNTERAISQAAENFLRGAHRQDLLRELQRLARVVQLDQRLFLLPDTASLCVCLNQLTTDRIRYEALTDYLEETAVMVERCPFKGPLRLRPHPSRAFFCSAEGKVTPCLTVAPAGYLPETVTLSDWERWDRKALETLLKNGVLPLTTTINVRVRGAVGLR